MISYGSHPPPFCGPTSFCGCRSRYRATRVTSLCICYSRHFWHVDHSAPLALLMLLETLLVFTKKKRDQSETYQKNEKMRSGTCPSPAPYWRHHIWSVPELPNAFELRKKAFDPSTLFPFRFFFTKTEDFFCNSNREWQKDQQRKKNGNVSNASDAEWIKRRKSYCNVSNASDAEWSTWKKNRNVNCRMNQTSEEWQ